jgi:acetyltransferase-like isoleucine patch superfamily enzyme
MQTRRLEHDWYPDELPANVSIGERSWLYSSFAFLHCHSQIGVRIGADTGVYNGSFFDLGPQGSVEIGKFCSIVGLIVCSNTRVVLGDYVFVAHDVVIADGCAATPLDPGRGAAPTLNGIESRSEEIVIGDDVWIGAQAIILAGAHIGAGSIIGAASVVDFPVPPLSLVAGNPARIIRRLGPND